MLKVTARDFTEQVGVAMMLFPRIQEVLALNLSQDTSYPDWGVCGFPQSLQPTFEMGSPLATTTSIQIL
jgi:hypothetical protein